jgi:O-acetyl-ADP-ribose deacetylase (regulator of RNase III)
MPLMRERHVSIVVGDITTQDTDAIVNAANQQLQPGGGVDAAITRAAGPVALADRERLIRDRGTPPLPTGAALVGDGGDLAARWIVYTAGPIYSGSVSDIDHLRSCHVSSMVAAASAGAGSIAFPAISCGVYGYPVEEAAPIAVAAVVGAVDGPPDVRFVLFDEGTAAVFRDALAAAGA